MEKKKLPRTHKEFEAICQKLQESAYEKGVQDGLSQQAKYCDTVIPPHQPSAIELLAQHIASSQIECKHLMDNVTYREKELAELKTQLETNKYNHLSLLRQLDQHSA